MDTFNAVTDCSVCKCTENKNEAFCSQKAAPGIVVNPPDKRGKDTQPSQCTPKETLDGGAAVMEFAKCSDFDSVGMMVTDFNQNEFGDLDSFESCAHKFNDNEDHASLTALGCLQILVKAMNANSDDGKGDDSQPTEAIAALAGLLYRDGESFCDCAKKASDDAPLCPSFLHFKTLLYESLDACLALDEIDCDAWSEFQQPCRNNMKEKYGNIDFTKEEQCQYVKDSCGGAGPFPAFRHLDCGAELPADSWDFYNDFAKGCMGAAPSPVAPAPKPVAPTPAPVKPPTPAPVKPPTPAAVPTPNVRPSDSSGKKPYVPPEERGKPSYKPGSGERKSHWFRNLLIICAIGGVAFYLYKRQSDGFSFVRYRRMGYNNYRDDNDMYSGLALESSTHFEPPSLPPTPSSMPGNYAL
jgi:cell division septation protein DedD